MRSSKWSRNELILAFERYFRVNHIHTSEENSEVQKFSDTLNSLPIHPKHNTARNFEMPTGVT